MKKIVVFLLVGMSFSLQAQPLVKGTQYVVKQAGRKAVSSVQGISALDRLDQWYQLGVQAKEEAQFQRRLQAALERQHRATVFKQNADPKRLEIFRRSILPTDPQKLPPLLHPFTGNEFLFARQYQEVMHEFMQLRKNFQVHSFFAMRPPHFVNAEKGSLITDWSNLLYKMKKLQSVYPTDQPLNSALEYTQVVLGELNPMIKDLFVSAPARTGRRFQKEEFVFDEMWFSQINRMAWPARKAELPQGLNVIVVNDDPTVLRQYALWKQQGLFPDWHFTFYDTAEAAIKDILSKKDYQLLITDWTVANSSVGESVRQLRLEGNTIPVIVCSSYTPDQINAEQMFKQGFDGFVSWANVSSKGPEHLVTSLRQYFFYKDYYKW